MQTHNCAYHAHEGSASLDRIRASMPDHRLLKKLLYGELFQGHRAQGGQKKRFKDKVKSSLKTLNMNHDSWEVMCTNRELWRSTIKNGAASAEQHRTDSAIQKRQARKERANSASLDTSSLLQCPHCPKLLRARIGLISHLRTHTKSLPPTSAG